MNNYIKKQIGVFKRSFAVNDFYTVSVLQLIKYVIFFLLLMGFIHLMVKIFASMQPFLDTVDMIKSQGATESLAMQFVANKYLFNLFMTKMIFLIIGGFVLFVLAYGIFDTLIALRLKKNRFNAHILLDALLIYFIISFIFFIVAAVLLFYVDSTAWLSLLWFILLVAYLVLISISQASLQQDKTFKKSTLCILKNIFSVKSYILPLVLIGIAAMVLLFFTMLISLVIGIYAYILGAFVYIIYTVWSTNYFFKIFS